MPAIPNPFATQTDVGGALTNLVASLYSGDGEARRAEREAKMERERVERRLKEAQIADYAAKRQVEQQEREARATAPLAIANSLFPGQGSAVMDFRNAGGVVQPQPETSEMPGIIGGYDMPRPAGYTPQREDLLTRLLTGIAASSALPGKTNFEQLAKGATELEGQGHRAGVIGDGTTDAARIAQAYFATSGKAPFSDDSGRVLNAVTGALNETGPYAVANVGKVNSERTENLAQAAKAGREGFNVETVADPSSPTGLRWATRPSAVGQPAPPRSATAVKDIFMPTTPNVTAAQGRDLESEDTLALIATARNIGNDPRNFGTSGILRATVQDAIQQGDALAMTLGKQGSDAQREVMALGSDLGLDNFDVNLPKLDLMTNLLAFRLAKMNDPGGKVSNEDFRNARAKITGGTFFGNQADFMARLDLFEQNLRGMQARNRQFLSGGVQRPGAPSAPAPAAATPVQPTAPPDPFPANPNVSLATTPAPAGLNSADISPEAAARVREGVITTFANGQQWTVQDGRLVRVK